MTEASCSDAAEPPDKVPPVTPRLLFLKQRRLIRKCISDADDNSLGASDIFLPWKLKMRPPFQVRFAGEGLLQAYYQNRLDFIVTTNNEQLEHARLLRTFSLSDSESDVPRVTSHSFLELSPYSATGFFDGSVRVNTPIIRRNGLAPGSWQIDNHYIRIAPADQPYPVVDAQINPVETCWLSVVTYRTHVDEYVISVYDLAQCDPETKHVKRIFAVSTHEEFVGFAWFFDNADMFLLVTRRTIRIFEMSRGTEPFLTLFVSCDLKGACSNPHRCTVFCCATSDSVLVFDRRILWCPTHVLTLNQQCRGVGTVASMRFNPMRSDELVVHMAGSEALARLFVPPPGDLHFMNRPPHRLRTGNSYIDISNLDADDVDYSPALIERRASFAPHHVTKVTHIRSYSELSAEEQDVAFYWGKQERFASNTSIVTCVEAEPEPYPLEATSLDCVFTDLDNDTVEKEVELKRCMSCPELGLLDTETLPVWQEYHDPPTPFYNHNRTPTPALTGTTSYKSGSGRMKRLQIFASAKDACVRQMIQQESARKKFERICASSLWSRKGSSANTDDGRLAGAEKNRMAHKSLIDVSKCLQRLESQDSLDVDENFDDKRRRTDSVYRRLQKMNTNHQLKFAYLHGLCSFEYSPHSAAIIGCGFNFRNEFNMETITPLDYPCTWGADKYSILSIKKVRFCSIYSMMGRDMYKRVVERAKQGAVNFSVEPGIDRLIDMKENSIDIFLEDAAQDSQEDLLFFYWYSRVFDLVHDQRPEPHVQAAASPEKPPSEDKWDPDKDEFFQQFNDRKDEWITAFRRRKMKKRTHEEECCSELTILAQKPIIGNQEGSTRDTKKSLPSENGISEEVSEEEEENDGQGDEEKAKAKEEERAAVNDNDEAEESDDGSETSDVSTNDECLAELACFRTRGLPGLLQLGSIPPTRVEDFDGAYFGKIKLHTGPERVAILRCVGMPAVPERQTVRQIARVYFDSKSKGFRPYASLLISMIYVAPKAVDEIFDSITKAYGEPQPNSFDDQSFGPIRQCHFVHEMWVHFQKVMKPEHKKEEPPSERRKWVRKYNNFSHNQRDRAEPELFACLSYMAMCIDSKNAANHRRCIAHDPAVPWVLRVTFCALYMGRHELLAAFYSQMEMTTTLSKLCYVGLGPHPDSVKELLNYCDATQDCQLCTFLLLTGECISTPINDECMQQERIAEIDMPGLAEMFPETYLDHDPGYERLYAARMRVVIDRYLTVLTSAKLHMMRCALHGLLYPPKQRKDAWWSISCGFCYEPVVGAHARAEAIQSEKDAAKKNEMLEKLAAEKAEAEQHYNEAMMIPVEKREPSKSVTSEPRREPKDGKLLKDDDEAPKIPRIMSCPMPLCRKPYPKCAVCLRSYRTPVVGYDHHMGHAAAHAFAFCMRCEHGGHGAHMAKWFEKTPQCPACDCRCLDYKDLHPMPMSKKLEQWREALRNEIDDDLNTWLETNRHRPIAKRLTVPYLPHYVTRRSTVQSDAPRRSMPSLEEEANK